MGAGWGVAESRDGECLARFEAREDAVDYARSIAIDNGDSILEAEDEGGILAVRQHLSTDAKGVIRLRSLGPERSPGSPWDLAGFYFPKSGHRLLGDIEHE
jgi:hypothetical protein